LAVRVTGYEIGGIRLEDHIPPVGAYRGVVAVVVGLCAARSRRLTHSIDVACQPVLDEYVSAGACVG
jgi:hypothetical protein